MWRERNITAIQYMYGNNVHKLHKRSYETTQSFLIRAALMDTDDESCEVAQL